MVLSSHCRWPELVPSKVHEDRLCSVDQDCLQHTCIRSSVQMGGTSEGGRSVCADGCSGQRASRTSEKHAGKVDRSTCEGCGGCAACIRGGQLGSRSGCSCACACFDVCCTSSQRRRRAHCPASKR